MRTFWIQTLGCKINQYESEQIATLLRSRGLLMSPDAHSADLHVINTCSVTMPAASKSRQTIRRTTSLPVLGNSDGFTNVENDRRTIVTGCWATSNRAEAVNMRGVDAVLGHHDDVAGELNRLLDHWLLNKSPLTSPSLPQSVGDDGSIIQSATAAGLTPNNSRPQNPLTVKQNIGIGTRRLPLLDQHQAGHQRAMLKVQDGCDAHCTYCIIPSLRSAVWSKPVGAAVEEARRLVQAGHQEIVLTGIFLGAYGQPTALRHRQPQGPNKSLAELVTALCTQVDGLRRLRFSSLEPGDLTPDLIAVMKSHRQVVPHFHLPLQSGSDAILRRMNRQYSRADFLRMIDQINVAFDRPAITTDIMVGFPGETDREFDQTLDVAERSGFIHIHAFSYSPRPGTAAARWKKNQIHGTVIDERIDRLSACAIANSLQFRTQFLNETVELLVEQPKQFDTLRHGRSERYFDVYFEDPTAQTGDAVQVKIDRITSKRTLGQKVEMGDLAVRGMV
ncbi:MAG TPA: MiaB/RimO family radical SAM methylthiotransferase [Tepidisphaeraceae bacterium]|nr:MiaB/RimO family radical SAM methylthiotransferase [Tepidisphaeraceae bacterium]